MAVECVKKWALYCPQRTAATSEVLESLFCGEWQCTRQRCGDLAPCSSNEGRSVQRAPRTRPQVPLGEGAVACGGGWRRFVILWDVVAAWKWPPQIVKGVDSLSSGADRRGEARREQRCEMREARAEQR